MFAVVSASVSAAHRGDVLALAILGALSVFMAYGVTARTSAVLGVDHPVDVEDARSAEERQELEWLAGERRRARLARRLRPILVVVGLVLLAIAGAMSL